MDVLVASRRKRVDVLADRVAEHDPSAFLVAHLSKGRGYADAVYQHSETSTSFYKGIKRWDGKGWEMRLDDGSMIHFPESYNAKNMAQGAAT